MYAIKLELKLNNQERTLMARHAGFSRFVYNYGLDLYKQVIDIKEGIPTSNKAKKHLHQVAKLHARIANIRRDFLQKLTTDISRKYYRIRIEDLNVSGMIANSKLADAISNLGLYEFRRQLIYGAVSYGQTRS